MTAVVERPAAVPWSLGAPQVLAGVGEHGRLTAATHRSVHGPSPHRSRAVLTEWCAAVGLRGRGGAAFPVAAKLAALPADGAAAIVVNGGESEPASGKDRTLLRYTPHLVLDGALLLAEALGAPEVIVSMHDSDAATSVRTAAAERADAGRVDVRHSHSGFVGGEVRTLLRELSGGPARPPGRRTLPTISGLRGRPTFAGNVETFAQLAVLARRGPRAFAATGRTGEAGTTLLTVGGAVGRPGVVEVPLGTPLDVLLSAVDAAAPTAVLLGGYHGTWRDPAPALRLSVRDGAPLAAGVVRVLDDSTCPLGELAAVAGWLAAQSAGQCGPCAFGLPALAASVRAVARGEHAAVAAARHRAELAAGRGACAHPDGAARFVTSGLDLLLSPRADGSGAVHDHAHGHCGRPVRGLLPVPGGPR